MNQKIVHFYLIALIVFLVISLIFFYDQSIRDNFKIAIYDGINQIKFLYVLRPKTFLILVCVLQTVMIVGFLPFYFLFNILVAYVMQDSPSRCWYLITVSSIIASVVSYLLFTHGVGFKYSKFLLKEDFVDSLSNLIFEKELTVHFLMRFLFIPQCIIELFLSNMTIEFKNYLSITFFTHAINSGFLTFIGHNLTEIKQILKNKSIINDNFQ